ncbi:MAG TPA: PAS domain-containing protein [Dongiaceae bacterium]|nr:PAS domain-containing protein [Dongiaceae bacterium]
MSDLPVPGSDWSPRLLADCHITLQRLYEYWDMKRGTRAMPARSDLDPVDMKALLPHLILIDVVPDERRYVYRLVGTREVEMRGSDPTGKAVKDAYYAESAGETMAYLDRVVKTQQPVLYRGTYQPTSTRTQEEDVLFLPLSKSGHGCDMILIYGRIQWMKDEPQV